ncbi:MAG: class I SAM-dependent methyltransferase [bacterium]|nr:class I SAM-dependent methyltransferase [bacterium]
MTFGEIIYLLAISLELLLFPLLAIYIISLIVSWLYGAPYVATRNDELYELLLKAKKHLTKNARFVELGCGDGRVTRMAVKKYLVKGIGYDINPILIFAARMFARFEHLPHAQFQKKNVLHVDLSKADIIYVFLLPPLILKMKENIFSSLKCGILIISHGFKIPYLQSYLFDQVDGVKFKTYYYRLK